MDLNKRLTMLMEKNKSSNPKYLLEVIKSDFFYLINNYFEVPFEDINVDFLVEKGKYNLQISCLGDRIKMVKSLPS